jgi:hypothetical protein
MEKELATIPEAQISAKTETQQLMDLIGMLAANPEADVAKFNALLDLKERLEDKAAEKQFNESYMLMAKELPLIKKDGTVEYKDKQTQKAEKAFNWAKWETMYPTLRPILEKHGFALTFDTQPRADGGGAIVKGILFHVGGHKREASITLALDSSGGKNNIQGMGSTFSYGKRYTATMLLNIVTIGEDDDGDKGGTEYITTEQAAELDLRIRKLGDNKLDAFLKRMKRPDLLSIPAKDYKAAIKLIETTEKAKK